MAIGTIPAAVQVNSRTPVDLTSVTGGKAPTETDGDNLANDGKVRLSIHNPESDTLTVAVTTASQDGVAGGTKSITVAADKTVLVGPFPVADYGETTKFVCSFAAAGVLGNVVLKAIKF